MTIQNKYSVYSFTNYTDVTEKVIFLAEKPFKGGEGINGNLQKKQ